jgi:DNA modification methylase
MKTRQAKALPPARGSYWCHTMSYATARKRGANSEINKLYPEDRSVHEWYRFVLSFPPHLVRQYLGRFGIGAGQRVLDPFCGTGTVLVECKKLGIASVGIEANAMAHFATSVKTDWTPDPDRLAEHACHVAEVATAQLRTEGIEDNPLSHDLPDPHTSLRTLPPESMRLLPKDSISPLPLHKTLVLLECLEQNRRAEFHRHELLALAKAVVYSISNLHFGPEVGVGKPKHDAPVISTWLAGVHGMVSDLREVEQRKDVPAVAHLADSRRLLDALEPGSIDAVITSPPYPNEKDYTRTTRLESVLLGLIRTMDELRALKKGLLRSNTRNVYKGDDDDAWIATYPEIKRIADEIEARRIALGKTSGFEKLYARVTKLYFGGMARHLAELRTVMRPGGKLAYVVGDQASYLQVMIPTGQLLADIGKSLGYEVTGIDLFRTRLATATKAQLREEILVLTWPCDGHRVVANTFPHAHNEGHGRRTVSSAQ